MDPTRIAIGLACLGAAYFLYKEFSEREGAVPEVTYD